MVVIRICVCIPDHFFIFFTTYCRRTAAVEQLASFVACSCQFCTAQDPAEDVFIHQLLRLWHLVTCGF